ncbi:Gfo/Idh/MocA family protein [Nitratireductor pacificus]|uniref:Oxidoreductase-like protein n=1 Tax=Nitratireductor pacificus pht-3B TaxID=391937 RepID=K2MCY8_9HYPH|nr:Gfo/Idh/MocA family oxidoreductase [Nitratireductor pacificus]EKF18610.1 oxidoreductase-like protein [Nitratireductor pacificus pht-3B]
MTIRYAIIGSGMMGQEHIRNLALVEDAKIVAIAEPDAAMRAAGAALAGPGVALHADMRDLLGSTDADAFLVASPNHTHADILDRLIDDGRPVLIEKPVVKDLAQARRIAAKAREARAPIWVAMEYRYMPGVSRLLEELRAGRSGELKMVSIIERRYPFLEKVGSWNRFNASSGGTLVEKCCHFFDLMRLMTGSEPVRVQSIGGQAVNHLDERYDGRVPDVLDHAFTLVEFANGVSAMLELCMFAEGSHFQERVSAIGTSALLEARVPGPGRFEPDGRHKNAEFVVARRDTRAETVETIEVDPELLKRGDHHGSTFIQHQRFNRMLREGGEPDVSLSDGLKAVVMGLAAQESILRRGSVDIGTGDYRVE